MVTDEKVDLNCKGSIHDHGISYKFLEKNIEYRVSH